MIEGPGRKGSQLVVMGKNYSMQQKLWL